EAQLLERPPTQQEIYQFRHTLTRDAVASAIPESRQTLLHVRVAEALEKLRDDRQSATIARHFAAGGDGARAVRYARDGARAAILAEALVHHADLAWAENDLRETARLAEDALGAAKRYQAPSVEVQALTLLGAASVRLGQDEGLERLAEATRRGGALALGAEAVDAHMELARALLFRGRNEDALDAVKAGLALARARGLEFAQARLLAHATTICVNLGRYEEARRFAEQSVALARAGTIAASAAPVSLAHVMSDQGEGEAALP